MLAHEPLDPLAADAPSVLAQVSEDARTAVRSLAFGMRRLDPDQQVLFLFAASALRSSEPCMVTADGDTHGAAQTPQRKTPGFELSSDVRVSYDGRLVKIPTAFFRISFSSFKRAYSRCRRTSSGSLALPWPGKAVSRSFIVARRRFQPWMRLAWMPSSRAVSSTLPRSFARRTASRL